MLFYSLHIYMSCSTNSQVVYCVQGKFSVADSLTNKSHANYYLRINYDLTTKEIQFDLSTTEIRLSTVYFR